MTKTILISVLLLSILLSACAPVAVVQPTASPTALQQLATMTLTPVLSGPAAGSPTPEVLSPTPPEPSPTLELTPSDSPIPLPTLAVATAVETPIPQPAADSGAIQVLTPGPMSKVVSPIMLRSYTVPGYDSKARVELYGEDGRLLFRQIIILYTVYKWSYFYLEIPFEVHAAGELGRLTVSTQDQYGQTTALNSVHLLLLSEGESQINPPDNLKERCVLDTPGSHTQTSGGKLAVAGKMRPLDSSPLVVELVTQEGTVLATRLVDAAPAPDDRYVPFSVDLSYSVPSATMVQLVVRQADDRIGGTMYLYSQEIFLNP